MDASALREGIPAGVDAREDSRISIISDESRRLRARMLALEGKHGTQLSTFMTARRLMGRVLG